jgi:translocation and assembly module TamB
MVEAATSEPPVKPRRGRGWRVFAWCGGLFALVLLLAAATLDYWAPSLALRFADVQAERRDTRAGREMVLEDITWRGDGLRLEAQRLEVSAPWRILRRGEVDAELSGWVLTVEDRPDDAKPRPEKPEGGGAWEELVPTLRRVAAQMERWAGEIELREGVVRVRDEEIEVERVAVWGDRFLARARGREQTVEIEGRVGSTTADIAWIEGGVAARAWLEPERARLELKWEGNLARAEAEFAPGEWMPARLRASGEDWTVPAARLGPAVAERYEVVQGDFELWGEGLRLRGGLRAHATPRTADLPELRLEVAAMGGPDHVRVERFELEAPKARARLSAPVEWRAGAGWSGDGQPDFSWEANLAPLTDGALAGRVEGSARWVPGADDWRVRWQARGRGLVWRELPPTDITLRGESDAHATTVHAAELTAADGSRAELRGRVLHATRELEAGVLSAKLLAGLLAPWLPEGARLDAVAVEGRASGVWPALVVAGELSTARVEHAGWTADAVAARIEGTVSESLRGGVELRRGEAELRASFELGEGEAQVEELAWSRGGRVRLRAQEPILARWAGQGRRIEAAMLGADGARLRLKWAEGGATILHADNLDASWLDDWRIEAGAPRLLLRSLAAEGRFGADGVLAGAGSFDLGGVLGGDEVWGRGAASVGAAGARLEKLEAGRGTDLLVEGSGLAPWRVRTQADGERELETVPDGAWDLRLESRAGAEWWDELAKIADLTLEHPTLSLRVEGPAGAPRGRAELGAQRIGLKSEDLPEGGLELRALAAVAEIAGEEISVPRLAATVDGQRIEAEGRLVLGEGDWQRLRERPYVWLRDHAEARVRVPEAQVAALARYLPTLLAPQGTVAAELRLSPPARLDGWVALEGAATRPLGNFGLLQDVEARLALSGMDVRVERMRATAGGQEVSVTGGARRRPGGEPLLDLTVKAERFPLVRKPGLLFRGDLDLTVKTDPRGRTRVGGEVVLRDSLFLVDIRPLITPRGGGGGGGAERRPPYFSVETPPLADWELGLRVGGVEFLRMRTPVFEGTGSARFDLAGTLREPRAVGEFWIERGNILFPFATFAVQEGAVRLRASDPYTPVLDFRAEGRRLGYDLRLELNGTADNPQLQLTSSPPLEADTVLLMVTAGVSPVEGRGASATQRLAAVGAYLGRDVLRTLGLGSSEEERLVITSGENVSRQGRETYGFEFRLTPKWALTGEYDEFDAYNVGLQRRFEARAPRGASRRPAPEPAAEPPPPAAAPEPDNAP